MITPQGLRTVVEESKTKTLEVFKGVLEERLKEAASCGLSTITFCPYDEKSKFGSEAHARILATALTELGFEVSLCETQTTVRTGLNEHEWRLMPALNITF